MSEQTKALSALSALRTAVLTAQNARKGEPVYSRYNWSASGLESAMKLGAAHGSMRGVELVQVYRVTRLCGHYEDLPVNTEPLLLKAQTQTPCADCE